jgi:hypothetical protein
VEKEEGRGMRRIRCVDKNVHFRNIYYNKHLAHMKTEKKGLAT